MLARRPNGSAPPAYVRAARRRFRPSSAFRLVFIQDLDLAQRRAFLVLARRVIDADNRVTLQEVERLDRLYAEAGLEAEHADAPSHAGDLNLMFGSRKSRVAVLLELLLLACVDGRVDPREEAAVRAVAAQMGVDAGTWQEARDWADRYQALMRDAAQIGTH